MAGFKVGQRLRDEIGIDWLLTVTSHHDFLRIIELDAGQAWCFLWLDADTKKGEDFYQTIKMFKGHLEKNGVRPMNYPEQMQRYFFSPLNPPPICPKAGELAHFRYKAFMEKEAEAKASPEQDQKIGPGGIIIGGLVGTIAMMALYKKFFGEDEED